MALVTDKTSMHLREVNQLFGSKFKLTLIKNFILQLRICFCNRWTLWPLI